MDYLERARALAPEIDRWSDQIERDRRLPAGLVDALHSAGMFRILLPRSLGGGEAEPATFVRVLSEISKADGSTAWCLGQTTVCSMVSAYLSREAASEVFGDCGVLTWGPPAPAQSRAEAVDGGYRVSGNWNFASGIRHASWIGALCPIYQPGGDRRVREDGAPDERTMLFTAKDVEITDVWHVMGLRGTASDAYAVKDLFVPQEHSVRRDNPAERRESGPLYCFSTYTMFACGFAGVALGIARATLDAVIAMAAGKTPRGLQRTVRESPVIQSQVAQMEGRLRAAECFLLDSLHEVYHQAGKAGEVTLPQRVQLRLAASHANRDAREVLDLAYYLGGAGAIFESGPFERRFRDMHAVSQQLQARQDHFERVGQFLLGLEPETIFL